MISEEIRKKNLTYEEALELLKSNYQIRRKDWKVGDCLFIRPEDALDIDFVKGDMLSIPKHMKDHLHFRAARGNILFTSYVCKYTEVPNIPTIINGWVPSSDDVMATDWEIIIP